jgi:hypothetical protein
MNSKNYCSPTINAVVVSPILIRVEYILEDRSIAEREDTTNHLHIIRIAQAYNGAFRPENPLLL